MAVYTTLAPDEISTALAPFELGRLTGAVAVAAGIENTTYFLSFEQASGQCAEYVLTLGESIAVADMEFVAHLTTLLHHRGLPVPAPVATSAGAHVLHLAHKPALVIPKVVGAPPSTPSTAQCRALGNTLAHLHQVMQQQAVTHTSHRSLDWVAETGRALLPHLSRHAHEVLESGLTHLDGFVSANENLPRAIIHGDLFRDNTLFEGERVTAIIDFFSAGSGYLLFDLAVVANDWCIADDCRLIPEKWDTLLAGYTAIRSLTRQEQDCWGEMLAIAALRFWVSRLAARIFPSAGRTGQKTKDPDPYLQLLIHHRQHPFVLDAGNK